MKGGAAGSKKSGSTCGKARSAERAGRGARPSHGRPCGAGWPLRSPRLSARRAPAAGAGLPARPPARNQKPGTSAPAPFPSPPPPISGGFLGNAAPRWSGPPRKCLRALSRARPGSSRECLRARGARGSQRACVSGATRGSAGARSRCGSGGFSDVNTGKSHFQHEPKARGKWRHALYRKLRKWF